MNDFLSQMAAQLAPALATALSAWVVYTIERLTKVKLDAAARALLDSAMHNGVDWIIANGRTPTPTEVMDYVRRAAPGAVARFKLDTINRDIATDRAKAIISQKGTK